MNRSTDAVEDLKMNHWRSRNSKFDVQMGKMPYRCCEVDKCKNVVGENCVWSRIFSVYKQSPASQFSVVFDENTPPTPYERHSQRFSIFWKVFCGKVGLGARQNLLK